MLKKLKFIMLSLMCLSFTAYGVITVSNEVLSTSKYIRNTSPIQIKCSLVPFDFEVTGKKYVFYISHRVIDNLENKIKAMF